MLFDTSVIDLIPELHDPVEILFGAQLIGGTDIERALAYCQSAGVQVITLLCLHFPTRFLT